VFIIRKRLSEEIVVGSTRYDETCECVQIWNGDEWVFDPASDPRNNVGLTLPPPTADDVRCAAAAGMVEALRQSIAVMEDASDVLGMANALFFAIIAFFPIGVLASVLLALAGLALTIGLSTLQSLFDEAGLETVREVIYCLLDDNGRIDQAGFDALPGLVDDALGSDIAAAWMFGWLEPLGVVGLNRAGVTYADPEADCSAYNCGYCCHQWFNIGDPNIIGNYTLRGWQTGALSPNVVFKRVEVEYQLNPNPGAVYNDCYVNIGLSGALKLHETVVATTGVVVWETETPVAETSVQILVASAYVPGGSGYPFILRLTLYYACDEAIFWAGGEDCPPLD